MAVKATFIAIVGLAFVLTACSSIPQSTKRDLSKSEGVLHYNNSLLKDLRKAHDLKKEMDKKLKKQIEVNKQLQEELKVMEKHG